MSQENKSKYFNGLVAAVREGDGVPSKKRYVAKQNKVTKVKAPHKTFHS